MRRVAIYPVKNLFGKWCRPNYNSVTATFCHNIAHDLPIQMSDPAREIELTYIDDVVNAFVDELGAGSLGFWFADPLESHKISLAELARTIQSFKEIRSSLFLTGFFATVYSGLVCHVSQLPGWIKFRIWSEY